MTANAQILQDSLDAADRGDDTAAMSIFHPDVVAHEAAALPFGGDHRGRPAYLAMLGELHGAYKLDVRDKQIIDGGDRVVLRLDLALTAAGTGRTTTQVCLEVLTFADGFVTDVDIFYKDTKAMADLLEPA